MVAAMLTAISLFTHGCGHNTDVYVDRYPLTPIPTNTPRPSGITHIDAICGPGLISINWRFTRLGLRWSPDGSLIVFNRGNTLYSVDLDEGVINVIEDTNRRDVSSDGMDIDVSPDGTAIAYTSCNYATEANRRNVRNVGLYPDWRSDPFSYNYEIVVSDIDGGNRRRMTEDLVMDRNPAWSHKGDLIAFISQVREGNGPKYDEMVLDGGMLQTVRPDGSDLRDMTSAFGLEATGRRTGVMLDTPPKWSPDDGHILFKVRDPVVGSHYGTEVIYSVDTVTLKLRRLPMTDVFGEPAWSPDGMQIAFPVQHVTEGRFDELIMYVYEVNGAGIQEIFRMDPTLWVSALEWSPDGSEVLLSTSHGLVVMGHDGSDPRIMPETTRWDVLGRTARWSPDGSRIAVLFAESGRRATDYVRTTLFTIDPDGSNKRELVTRQ